MMQTVRAVTRDFLSNTICFLIILCVVAGSFAAGPSTPGPAQKVKCPACGMFVSMFADWNSKITYNDSSQAVFDGAKCMFKYYLDVKRYDPSKSKDDISLISVKDYYSKKDIDARSAFYVVWSDMYGPMGHEPIPFGTETEANKFLKEHKGKQILKFGEITAALITSLDNPP
jgi:copper chaperone NosL